MRSKILSASARLAAALVYAALPGPSRAATPSVDIRRDAVVEAVAKVMPSVVNIGTETLVRVRHPFEEIFPPDFYPFQRGQRFQSSFSLGSGVIVDEAGYILTNDHVVRRARRIAVKIGTNEYAADLVASSPGSDVALLKIGKPGEKFPAAKFGRDDDLLLGETVIALGNPFGLGGSVSRGILSSKNRRLELEKDVQLEVEDWLQTDAAINPGNSGGPLINLNGEVIGMNVAVYRAQNAEGIGFAIPIKRVAEALASIFTPEETRHLWFGARVRPTENRLAVTSIEPGSPADKAGLKSGDRVLQVGTKVPKNFIEFIVEVLNAGDKGEVALLVDRGGQRQELRVRLVPENTVFNADLIRQKLGVIVQEITPDIAELLGLQEKEGVLIGGVDRDSPAGSAGLQRGSVVISIDGQPVDSLLGGARLLFAKKRGETVRLGVHVYRRYGNALERRTGEYEVQIR